MPRFSTKLITPKAEIDRKLYFYTGIFSFIFVFLVWAAAAVIKNDASFIPTPAKVLSIGLNMLTRGELAEHAAYSIMRVAGGFLLASIIAVPLGILMGTLKIAEAFFEPIIGFIRYMPASAFIPLFILWFGLGESEKIAVIFFGTFFQQTLMVMDVTKNVPVDLIDVSYTLGASRKAVFRKVILPASLPGIVDTLRITFGWAWTYLVVAEIVGASEGLGYLIMQASRFLRTDKIFVGILVIGLLGIISDYLFKVLYRALFPYLRSQGGTSTNDKE
ncbi:MAG: ABC transporter permease [Bacillota bacterium]|uniref:ABC transporter permease subunit n=1 Tax=Thermanaerosceptrum fracticalcis TaxID=1712410 RepID=A0A7G6E7T1_THEFR|nr:ABC transporter permease [Thermanaerosceptrum fracticalcis]QNB48135.1 ABC transporter permease subunit [Thermanaerosceptrum fracticalcis]